MVTLVWATFATSSLIFCAISAYVVWARVTGRDAPLPQHVLAPVVVVIGTSMLAIAAIAVAGP